MWSLMDGGEMREQTERNAEMRVLRAGGATLQAIADRYGLTRARVCQIVGPRRKVEVAEPQPVDDSGPEVIS